MPPKPYLDRRRAAAAARWELRDEVVVIGAGDLLGKPGRGDQKYPFHVHPEYFYLADRLRPGSVLAFDPAEGWTDFVPEVTEDERVWEGAVPADPGPGEAPHAELDGWLSARSGRPLAVLGAPPAGVEADEELTERLRGLLSMVRRPKDDEELARMRAAVRATEAGYAALRPLIRPGVTERALQVELEAAFFRAGADATAYGTIVGSGPNAAVLHFEPGARALRAGELLLIDAGAEVGGYVADVSRTYPVDGRFTPEQQALYDVVLAAEEASIARCRAGTEVRDLHLAAAVDLTRGLVELGLLRGDPESLVEQEAHSLFFPHGIGHLVGLGVRDAAGGVPGRKPSEHPALKKLRTDLPLEPGMAITIEPGIYFIPALLDDPARRERHRDQVDWDRVERLRDFGGIRIEDDVLVTAGDPEILTAGIPKR
ncbi:MAG TPA: aminopeptidase P family protein [Longimicrobiaceae bacterium]|nr:aminopeptidase P family protein [Longimicrobiaceae bacterium]